MKAFFDKKRKNPYPSKVDDYTEKQIKELGKTWKNELCPMPAAFAISPVVVLV